MSCFDTESNTYESAKRLKDKGYLKDKRDIYTKIGLDMAIEKIEVLSVSIDESDEATAKVTAKLKATAVFGTMEAPAQYNLICKDGKWYITD